MKPKSIRAAIQMMLPEVEQMLSLGVSREEVFKAVSERYGLSDVNVRSFDTALYRARQNREKQGKKSVLHNTQSSEEGSVEKTVMHNTDQPEAEATEDKTVLHNTQNQSGVKESKSGIIGKEFFDEANSEFDPNKFINKY